MINLKIKSLKKGWHDKDEVMLHSSFQLLIDYVEKEKPEHLDWNWHKEHREAWRTIKDLYHWWKKIRPKREYPPSVRKIKRPPARLLINILKESESINGYLKIARKTYPKYFRACEIERKYDAKWEEEDQKNLLKLFEIRPFLWT